MARRSSAPTAVDERARVLERIRNAKMARSSHAYVRGNTIQFYEWLESLESSRLPHGPPVWICGDCHVGNHTIFGEVVEGQDVVDKISKVKKGAQDRPVKDVVINSITIERAA